VNIQAIFAEKELRVSDLLNFEAGDIIPIDMPEQMLVLAEDMPVMRGQYGEYQGNAAVKIDEIVEVYDPENTDIKNAIVLGDQTMPRSEKANGHKSG